jgi:hypothetical protein
VLWNGVFQAKNHVFPCLRSFTNLTLSFYTNVCVYVCMCACVRLNVHVYIYVSIHAPCIETRSFILSCIQLYAYVYIYVCKYGLFIERKKSILSALAVLSAMAARMYLKANNNDNVFILEHVSFRIGFILPPAGVYLCVYVFTLECVYVFCRAYVFSYELGVHACFYQICERAWCHIFASVYTNICIFTNYFRINTCV